jgi:hypothetical protein
MNRRQLLFSGLGLTAMFVPRASAAKEFWNTKPASEWMDGERQQVLTKSPWTREVVAQFNTGSLNRPDGDPGGPRGGMSMPGGGNPIGGAAPGGMGGVGMPPAPNGMPPIRVTVRWESAMPVRDALKSAAPKAAYYVVSLSGFPMRNGGLRSRNREPATLDETLGAMQTRYKAWLTIKSNETITPHSIGAEPNSDGVVSSSSRAISAPSGWKIKR